MAFKSTAYLKHRPGHLFLGRDGTGQEIGVKTDRHSLLFAGTRSGKGAAIIIPNLKRWTHNALVIDPKGENAAATWQERQEMGQQVYVVDPFQVADVPDEIRASFNPLEGIDDEGLTAGSDLLTIGDGLIKKSNPEHAEWDDTAAKILAGVMGYVLAEAPEDKQTMTEARNILLQTPEDLQEDALRMMQSDAFDGVVRDAGNIILSGIENEKGIESQALSQAKRQTQWVGMKAFRNVLESSTFDIGELKTGKVTVFLVLPPEYLNEHGAFLKLFVQTAVNAMLKGGAVVNQRCLFILDEVFSLGRLDRIMSGFGLLAGYGVQMLLVLQDLGQLILTYGQDALSTFFGNSDVSIFFGTTDELTLNYISNNLGVVEIDEINLPYAPQAPVITGASMGRGVAGLGSLSKNRSIAGSASVLGGLMSAGEGAITAARQASYQDEMNNYQLEMQRALSKKGQPRVPPDRVGQIIQRPTGGGVARGMICFVSGHGAIQIKLAPYFQKYVPPPPPPPKPSPKNYLGAAGKTASRLLAGGLAKTSKILPEFSDQTAKRIGLWSLICMVTNGLVGAVQTILHPEVQGIIFGRAYMLVLAPLDMMGVRVWSFPLAFGVITSLITWIALIAIQWKANQQSRPVEGALLLFLLLNVPWIIFSARHGISLITDFFVYSVGFYALSIPGLLFG